MSLTHNLPIGFIPTCNATAARDFYEHTLGLRFVRDDHYAMLFRVGPRDGTMLRVTRTPDFTPLPFTLFGWQVNDIDTAVKQLVANGVVFERYDFLQQDKKGIWKSPSGNYVAWFKDPDGNLLSVSQHPPDQGSSHSTVS